MNDCKSCAYWEPNHEVPKEQTEDGKYRCLHPDVAIRTRIDFGCAYHLGQNSTEANVPNHTRDGTMVEPNPNPVDGPTEILIVSHAKDFPWLELALRSIIKFCKGFQGVTVVVPVKDFREATDLVMPINWHFNVEPFPEVRGKGMLHHMVKMAEAELLVPEGTKYVLHSDSDCIFKMLTTPEHYFWNDKPYYLIRSWSSLGVPDPRHPINRIVSDCGQWKPATDAQLGWDTEWYTMCMNTAVLPIDFYKSYRAHVQQAHRKDFEQYMLEGRNEFPQDRMDWTAMGAFAHRFMNERFTWFDVCNGNPYPTDRKQAYWSHGGITPEIKSEIEAMLA